ncbi:hypothetical protein T10_7659 [Trichinella papuae]|uniref:Uncharacterized protein n=1 Tax=Trichinella papuae TaxID=268474 RepID=A0A0V1MI02_9BILA|nr:hypothetical protein T10_7659 [Trichinella papuae]
MCKQWFLLFLVALVAVVTCNGFQCRIKWHLHGQNCYRIMNHKTTFSIAQKICKLYDSKLLVLRSFEELKNAFELFSDSQFFWVTLNMTEEKDMDIQNMQDSLYAIPVINGIQMRSNEDENCFLKSGYDCLVMYGSAFLAFKFAGCVSMKVAFAFYPQISQASGIVTI